MDLATRLATVKIDDIGTMKEDKLDQLSPIDHTKRSCLNPKLPVEIECMIYAKLSVGDLVNLAVAYPRSRYILGDNRNSRQIAKGIITHDTQRLRDQIEYLNFTGLSLVTAFRRYIRRYGLRRHHNYFPQSSRFARTYFQANPGLYRDEREVEQCAGIALMISDWLQHYEKGTGCTPAAGYIEASSRTPPMPNWRHVLHRLCLPATEGLPETYHAWIELWQKALLPPCSPQAIILLFEEVRARPLVDLSECPQSMWPRWVPLNLEPDGAGKEIWQIPDSLLERLELPKTYFGLSVHVGTCRKKGRKLIRQFLCEGDHSGLLLAELMKQLKIVWQ